MLHGARAAQREVAIGRIVADRIRVAAAVAPGGELTRWCTNTRSARGAGCGGPPPDADGIGTVGPTARLSGPTLPPGIARRRSSASSRNAAIRASSSAISARRPLPGARPSARVAGRGT
jgi:hypothetical protein